MSPHLRSRIQSLVTEMKSVETSAIYEAAEDNTEGRYKLLQGFGTIGHARNQVANFLATYDVKDEANSEQNTNEELATEL